MFQKFREQEWRWWGVWMVCLSVVPAMLVGGEMAAIWPSVVALGLVLLMRQVLAGLVGGAAAGSLILSGGDPVLAFIALFDQHLMPSFESSWKVGAILFTFMLGGFAALLEAGGGFRKIFERLAERGERRRLLAGAGLFGIVCFFDGLANSMMVGRIFRSWADRLGIARVKLAYLADTTSSAVACLAFISTWIAYQLAMIREGYALAGREAEAEPYRLFFQSIPYNFYCWSALGLLAVVIWRDWNIGPMKRFEAEARRSKVAQDGTQESRRQDKGTGLWRSLVPLLFLVGSMLGGLYVSGVDEASIFPVTLTRVADAFGQANAALVLVTCSAAASLLAFALFPHRRAGLPVPFQASRTPEKASRIYLDGVQNLFGAVLVLLAAWMLSSTLGALGAGEALARLLSGNLPIALLPAAVFVTGAVLSFTTGTSWGTMGILMPLAIPVTFHLGEVGQLDEAGLQAILAAVTGAVFSGAVFGDHCSPLSDTTLVSSIACGVEPHDHVSTQLPYAGIAAGLALFIGFLPTGFGLSPFVVLSLMALVLVALPLIGRSTPA